MSEASTKAEQWFDQTKQWFNKHGVGNLILGAGGFAAAFAITMKAASSWMGGGALSAILALPVAFTGGLLGAVALPGATNTLWAKITGEPLFPPAKEPVIQQEIKAQPSTVVSQAELKEEVALGDLTPPSTGVRPQQEERSIS